KDKPAHLLQLLSALNDRQEMIARQLSHLAGEESSPIWEEDFSLAVTARIEQDLPRSRMAGVIFEADASSEVTQRHPGRLAAPARLDQLRPQGEHSLEGSTRLRGRLGLPSREKHQRADSDADHSLSLVMPRARAGQTAIAPSLRAS